MLGQEQLQHNSAIVTIVAYLHGLVSAAVLNFSNPSKVDFGIVLKPQFKNNSN